MVYVNENLSSNERRDLETNQNQLILELSIEGKKVFVSTNYRKHHANKTQLEGFMEKFNTSILNIKSQNPYASFFIGDFNSHQQSVVSI